MPALTPFIITDYANIHRISNLLRDSSRLDAPQENGIRRRLVSKICILFFCFESEIVEDVEETGRNTVLTTVVPELSDFVSGNSRWHIQSLDQEQTLLRFRYDMEPLDPANYRTAANAFRERHHRNDRSPGR